MIALAINSNKHMPSNKKLRLSSISGVALGCAVVALLVFALLFELLVRAESGKIEANRRSEAVSYGSMLRTQVDRELNALLFVSGGLASYLNVYHAELDPAKVQAILADLYARTKHVRNLGISVGYRMTYLYPVKSNEKAIGIDYRNLPKQWPQVAQAVETRQGVLAGPLDLVQGGKALIYRYPVFIHDHYWGILSTVINTEPFLQAAFGNLNSSDYDFSIRSMGLSDQPGETFYGKPALFADPHAHILQSEVPNGKWQWAILRKTEPALNVINIMRGMGLAISLMLAALVYFFVRERIQLAKYALYDSLTGLANRRLLQDRLKQAWAQASRFGRSMAVMYIDLDHFKQLNDTHGHDFGDELLKMVALQLASCIRNVDTLSRVGGDEFVIVLEEISQPQDAYVVAENILTRFQEPLQVARKTIELNLSVGIAIYQPGSADSVSDLLKQADSALYEVKRAGRNDFLVFGDEIARV